MRALKLALFASLLTFGLASVAHGISLPQSQLLQLDLTSTGNIYTEVGDAVASGSWGGQRPSPSVMSRCAPPDGATPTSVAPDAPLCWLL